MISYLWSSFALSDPATDIITLAAAVREQSLDAAPGPGVEDDAELAESTLMVSVPVDQLDSDVRGSVESEADDGVAWVLRRRGPGVPRWLIGTDDGRAWRVTRWRGVNVDRAATAAAEHAVEPVSFDALRPDPVEAHEALERMLEEGESSEVLLRRIARGVPVFFALTDRGRVLRLVHTRWGWGGAPEGE